MISMVLVQEAEYPVVEVNIGFKVGVSRAKSFESGMDHEMAGGIHCTLEQQEH